jgi:hypothetical protein
MGPRPWKPEVELQRALERGDLPYATTLATELTAQGKPIDLPTAAAFLPLVALQQTDAYDRWASRWFARWLAETPAPTIDLAAEVAATLADLPSEPSVFETIRQSCRA